MPGVQWVSAVLGTVMRSLAQTSSAVDSLAALLPDEAEKVVGDSMVAVAPTELDTGDVVMVRPGGRVPADGEIVDGTAHLDESDDHRGVQRGPAYGRRPGRRRVAIDTRSGSGSPRSATTRRLPAFSALVADAQSSSTRAQRLATGKRV